MAALNWLKRLIGINEPQPASAPAVEPPAPAPAPESESSWSIGLEDDTLALRDPHGKSTSLAISQLSAVAIEANEGDNRIDLWWLFYGPEEDVSFTLPFGARGEGAMVERIAALPGFRHDLYADAVRSTDLDTFVVWSRPFA